jgi:hypothetical protein
VEWSLVEDFRRAADGAQNVIMSIEWSRSNPRLTDGMSSRIDIEMVRGWWN